MFQIPKKGHLPTPAVTEPIQSVQFIGVSINGGTPIAGWFVRGKSHLEMDDLEVPLFQETYIYIYIIIFSHY